NGTRRSPGSRPGRARRPARSRSARRGQMSGGGPARPSRPRRAAPRRTPPAARRGRCRRRRPGRERPPWRPRASRRPGRAERSRFRRARRRRRGPRARRGLAGRTAVGTVRAWRRVRTRLLASTGHAYWFVAVRVALVCALASVAGVLINAMAERLRGRATTPAGPAPTALALAVIQVGGYAAMEVVERLVAKAPLSTLLVHDVLLLGVLIQVGVAGLLSLALWSLRRAADRLTSLAAPLAPTIARRTFEEYTLVIGKGEDAAPALTRVSHQHTLATRLDARLDDLADALDDQGDHQSQKDAQTLEHNFDPDSGAGTSGDYRGWVSATA